MASILLILSILAQPGLAPSLSNWDTAKPAELERWLADRGIRVLQTIDARTSSIAPLPQLRET
ncbi:MAG: hypothetical protein ABIH23_18135, partial [bacterium]